MQRVVLIFLVIVGGMTSLLGKTENPTTGAKLTVPPVIAVDPGQAGATTVAELDTGPGLILQRQADSHFYADVQINNSTIRMLVDTGASGIALTRDDARRAGIGISIGMPNVVGQGAGGEVKGEYVTLERVSLGNENAQSMQAVVLDGGGQSLLGQSFLGQFASVEIKGDRMVLR